MTAFERDDPTQPGFDLHEWEGRWASIVEDLDGDPAGALSQLTDVVEHMLEAGGYAVRDPVARGGDEPEVVVTYRSARETAERAELGAASRSEIDMAIEDLRDLFGSLSGEVGAPE